MVAEQQVERRFGAAHLTDRLFGVFRQGLLRETEAFEQALSRDELKGMVLHQQDTQVMFGHKRAHTESSVVGWGVGITRQIGQKRA